MGEAKRRKETGAEPRTVRLPALTHDEVHVLHHLMHHRLDELAALPEDQQSDALRGELEALRSLHHKIFAH